MTDWITACLGLGGNIGDVRAAMISALAKLDGERSIRVVDVSPIYKTPPWGNEDQDWFLNACALVKTTLSAKDLLDACLDAEKSLKRIRKERWGPRTIDLDILIYGDKRVDEPNLQIPHPRIAERVFVLKPMADLLPDAVIDGITIGELLAQADASQIEVSDGGKDWFSE